jgi:hypothetical protein
MRESKTGSGSVHGMLNQASADRIAKDVAGNCIVDPVRVRPIEALLRIPCGHRSRERWISPLGNWMNKIPSPALPDRYSADSHTTFQP